MSPRQMKEKDVSQLHQISTPEDAALECADVADKNQEHLCVLLLNTRYEIIDKYLVREGSIEKSSVPPKVVFRPAVLLDASSVYIVHNNPHYSELDEVELNMAKILAESGRILDIEVIDHVIVGNGSGLISLKESHYL